MTVVQRPGVPRGFHDDARDRRAILVLRAEAALGLALVVVGLVAGVGLDPVLLVTAALGALIAAVCSATLLHARRRVGSDSTRAVVEAAQRE